MSEIEELGKTVVSEAPVEPPPFEPAPRRGRPPKYGIGTRRGKAQAALEAEVSDVDVKSIEAAWQGLWLVLRFVGRLFGFESDVTSLPETDAQSDAAILAPLVAKHPTIGRVLGWIGAPVVIIRRVTEHFHRKPRESAAPKVAAVKSGGGSAPTAPTPFDSEAIAGAINVRGLRPGA